jgi:hypothetical protein
MEFITGFLVGVAALFIFVIQYSKYATAKSVKNNQAAIQKRIAEINAEGLAPEEDKEHV